MARQPAEIVLSVEERSELGRRAACYTLPHKVVQRARLVLYAAEGLSNAEIARRLDGNADVIGRWRSRFARERLAGLEDRARSGRPAPFSPAAGRAGQGDRVRAAARGGVALSRFSLAELHRLVIERAVCAASASTIARWLSEDAIKPWQHRSWIFPRDPRFLEKAGPIFDLYERRWQGELDVGDVALVDDDVAASQERLLSGIPGRHVWGVSFALASPGMEESGWPLRGTAKWSMGPARCAPTTVTRSCASVSVHAGTAIDLRVVSV